MSVNSGDIPVAGRKIRMMHTAPRTGLSIQRGVALDLERCRPSPAFRPRRTSDLLARSVDRRRSLDLITEDVSIIHQSHPLSTDDDLCRRALLSLAVRFGALSIAGPAFALPGFKKDLSNRRRLSIPVEDYKDGPSGLKYYDISVGTGPEAKEGSRVAVHFDAKWRGITFVTSRQGIGVTGGTPLGFDVGAAPGAGGTLKGLDVGVRGMRVGGQRRLLVPPNLAYGKKGYGEIPPDATLEIDVQLLSIKTSAAGTRVKLIEG